MLWVSFTLLLTNLVAQVLAHGYIRTITVDGVPFQGFSRWNPSPAPDAIGWSFSTPDEGPVLDYRSPDFICRHDSTPSANSAPVPAGGNVDFFWISDDLVRNPDGWAPGHKGPILTYIAPCNGDCATVDKTTLRWTKIAEEGIIEGPANTQGYWATDKMRDNAGTNSATIPETLAPGNYVIRNEIIALHRAHLSEPEFYMQCGNIEVTGSGTDDLSGAGVPATELYSPAETQIFGFSVHDNRESTWPIPGPALYEAAAPVAPSAPAAPVVSPPAAPVASSSSAALVVPTSLVTSVVTITTTIVSESPVGPPTATAISAGPGCGVPFTA
jgi:cellulase